MRQAVRLSWIGNLEKFSLDIWPDAFKAEKMIDQRREYMDHLADETIAQLAITAYRGFFKTTGILLYMAYCAAFRIHPYVQYVSKAEDYSIAQCQNMLQMVLANPTFREYFGNIKPVKYEGLDPQFSRGAFFLSDPHSGKPFMLVNPRGWEQQINGALAAVGDVLARPTLQIVDDGEDREAVMNVDRRKKYRGFIDATLFPCVSEERPGKGPWQGLRWKKDVIRQNRRGPWRRIYADTIKHNDAYLSNVLTNPHWTVLRYPKAERRADGQYYSLIPTIVSDEEIRTEIKGFADNGDMDHYAREYLCRAQADESAVWTRDMYQYFREGDLRISTDPQYQRYIIMDPARTAKKTSCPSAILAVAVDTETGKYYLRKLKHGRIEWTKQLDEMFKLAIDTHTKWIGVEITGSDDIIKHQMEQEKIRRGLTGVVQFVWLDGRDVSGRALEGEEGNSKQKGKEVRAETVFPLYVQRRIYHEISLKNGPLEAEQLGYPENVQWDALDCAGYIPVMDRKLGIVCKVREQATLPHHYRAKDKKLEQAMAQHHRIMRRRAFI
jgi:uncharacterized protein YuzE